MCLVYYHVNVNIFIFKRVSKMLLNSLFVPQLKKLQAITESQSSQPSIPTGTSSPNVQRKVSQVKMHRPFSLLFSKDSRMEMVHSIHAASGTITQGQFDGMHRFYINTSLGGTNSVGSQVVEHFQSFQHTVQCSPHELLPPQTLKPLCLYKMSRNSYTEAFSIYHRT